jgi:hypothetical protein
MEPVPEQALTSSAEIVMKYQSLIVLSLSCGLASADVIWPHNTPGPMRHIMVSLDGTTLHTHVEGDPEPTLLDRYPGEAYFGAASVLEGMAYGNQFGWMADGFINPGAGNTIAIELVSGSAGLMTYQGGMRSMVSMHTFAPIFGTAGSSPVWNWSGMMVHHWYAAAENGDYEATYRIFVSDSAGNAVAGYTDAFATLHFRAVPAPGGTAALAVCGLLAARRRRGGGA